MLALPPNSKAPPKGIASSTWAGNVALTMGGDLGLATLDADTTASAEANASWAKAQGLRLPAIRTASGNTNTLLRLRNAPTDRHMALLSEGGELRFGAGVYVTAPPSTIDGGTYVWLGYPEQVLSLPPVDFADVQVLLGTPTRTTLLLEVPPVPLIRRRYLPKHSELLLALLRDAPKGKPVLEYATRSEGEAAVTCSAICAGWTYAEVLALFLQAKPGHFADHKHHGAYYLRRLYKAALGYLASNATRQAIAAEYAHVLAQPWPGATGLTDQAVLLALLSLAWAAGNWAPYSALRDLAELSRAQVLTVRRALQRLHDAGRIRMRVDAGDTRRWYVVHEVTHILHPSALGEGVEGAPQGRDDTRDTATQELWGRAMLGRSAHAVYEHLSSAPLAAADLAGRTGKAVRTIYNALERLERQGLAQRSAEGWKKGSADLAQVAQAWNVEDALREREQRNDAARQAWARRKKGHRR